MRKVEKILPVSKTKLNKETKDSKYKARRKIFIEGYNSVLDEEDLELDEDMEIYEDIEIEKKNKNCNYSSTRISSELNTSMQRKRLGLEDEEDKER